MRRSVCAGVIVVMSLGAAVWSNEEAITEYDPVLASEPWPVHEGYVDVRRATVLAWSGGETAVEHDVYLGMDANAVAVADVSSPLYWGRQTDSIFRLLEPAEIGAQYFWRIDEIEADGATIHKGGVWSFTVSGYSIVDDFESYTEDKGRRIEETWLDGLANDTGSRVSRWISPTTSRRVDKGNRQAMSLNYDNAGAPQYSEVERRFDFERDWTADLVDTLSLWVKGDVVSFGEIALGEYAVSASGSNIWSDHDQCRYVFRRLDGDGSMAVRVDSLVMTDVWCKAGVMIRESLDPGSAHASMFVTPDGRRAFQNRPVNGSGFCYSAQSSPGAISLPYWIKIERRGNRFTGYHSPDGVNWIEQPDNEEVVDGYQSPNPQTIEMPAGVYIGFALTSRNSSLVTTATFSDVKTAGYVGTKWQEAQIGCVHPGNCPDDLYVIVEDAEGETATATNTTAVNTTAWSEWRIPFSDLAGVDLTRVKRMFIGVGGRETSAPLGSGRILIDDVLVWRP